MKSSYILWSVLVGVLMASGVHSADFNLETYFAGYSGAMVILDAGTGETIRYNPDQCARRESPCSTFKIPNAVFGLDAGILSGPDHVVPWDGKKRFYDVWNQDLNLKQAITFSSVPYFQHVARLQGIERMQTYVTGVNYGNKDITGGLDRFWLESSLKISPDEQVEFLSRLFSYHFDVKRQSVNSVSRMLLQKDTPRGSLYGKTGSGKGLSEGMDLGWFVGFVDTKTTRYYFAVNILSGNNPTGSKAREITVKILTDLGFLGELESLPVLKSGFKQRVNGVYRVFEERTTENRFDPVPADCHLVTYDQSYATGVPGIPVRYVVISAEPGVPMVLGTKPEKQIHENGNPSLQIQFERKYADQLRQFTSDNLNKSIAMVIGGKVVTMHKVRAAIEGGRVQITRCSDKACDVLYSELID